MAKQFRVATYEGSDSPTRYYVKTVNDDGSDEAGRRDFGDHSEFHETPREAFQYGLDKGFEPHPKAVTKRGTIRYHHFEFGPEHAPEDVVAPKRTDKPHRKASG